MFRHDFASMKHEQMLFLKWIVQRTGTGLGNLKYDSSK